MSRRLHAPFAALSALPLLGGCVQMTRHSNTMLFGTNTTFGIKVGTGATEVPSVTVGYDRQEAVIMPLVANTGDNGTFQTPCDLSSPVGAAGGAQYLVHPCAMIAVRGAAQDSYSVLASFGAKFDAGSGAAKGGLAQYFATGMAAQLLALSGGASLVAVGDAATEAAAHKPDAGEVKALFGDEKVIARGIGYRTGYEAFQAKLIEKVSATNPGNLQSRINDFEGKTVKEDLATDCPDPAKCVENIKSLDPYRRSYGPNAAKFDLAIVAWAVP